MSSHVTIDSVNSPPRQIQACLDSTIMTYLQQQQQQAQLQTQVQAQAQAQAQAQFKKVDPSLFPKPRIDALPKDTAFAAHAIGPMEACPGALTNASHKANNNNVHARDQTQEVHLSRVDKIPNNILSTIHRTTIPPQPQHQLSSQSKPREESDEDSDVSIDEDDDDYDDEDDDEFDSEMDDSDSYYDSESASEQEQKHHQGIQRHPSAVTRSDLDPTHSSNGHQPQHQLQPKTKSGALDVSTGCNSKHLFFSAPKILVVRQENIARETTEALSTQTEAPSIVKITDPKDPSPIPNPNNYTLSPQAKARVIPHVERENEESEEYSEDAEEEEEEEEEDEEEEEEEEEHVSDIRQEIDEEEEEEEEMDDEDDEDEDDYSCSEDDEEEEDDDEDDESLNEYHYGARQDRSRPKGHYSSQSGYPHFRPTRLDENLLQKRAITKQVVRRSSLTALFGEAQFQPDFKAKSATVTHIATFGQQQQQSRRPALSGLWPEPSVHALDNDVKTSALLAGRPVSALGTPELLKQEAVESNRPRRTDSGVEVKISPSLRFNSPRLEASDQRRLSPGSIEKASLHSSSSTSGQSTPPHQEVNVRRLRIKSEGDIPESPVAAHSLSEDQKAGTCSIRPSLKPSISANTFPRAASKRSGKHVRWHHSLFPTERVLRVKPSLPSLSTVAAESAEATLSQLPPVPVMARDKVKGFHQSIRSLRTLSRIEITKMSYKQQGRQELTSPVPISKSVNDSVPWWNPSRWLKGPVSVDKRHWKPDSSRESCAYCYAPFHRISNPRHHCRKCGDIFCGQCASAEILMDAKNCVYVQQSQLARWSRRVDIQRHSLWIDTLPQLHPVRTAAESGLVGSGTENKGSVGHAGGHVANGLGGISMGQRSASGSGSGGRRGSLQMGPAALKKSRLSIFGLFGPGGANGGTSSPYAGSISDSRRGSMDISANDHSPFLQPHNSVGVAFATGRRASSSSLMRNNTVSGSSNLMMTDALGPIAMSRRMSSGGVGEVCLARICVGCERELIKPTKRCTSIAKYYTIGARPGYRGQGYPPGFGHHGYGHPHPYHQQQHHQHPQQQLPPSHPQADEEAHSGNNYDHNGNGVRRHSPLRQTYVLSEDPSHEGHNSGYGQYGTQGHVQGPCRGQAQGGPWSSREEAVGPHGEARYCQGMSFQQQQLQYAQTCFSRELS
ncbi:hypothetical protein CPC16_007215 [Podila verticillata]|nr:hypothetical protein CPC16_007215 [Podila verticillata]